MPVKDAAQNQQKDRLFNSRSGQGATVIIFALMVGIIFLLLAPASSYATQRKITRAADDIETVIRSHQLGESLLDYLKDDAAHRARNLSYTLGQDGGGLNWTGTGTKFTDRSSVRPTMREFKEAFTEMLAKQMTIPEKKMLGCQLEGDLKPNYTVFDPYRQHQVNSRFYDQTNLTHGFILRMNYTGNKRVQCQKDKSRAVYRPDFDRNITLPHNRYFVFANLSIEFLNLSTANLSQEVADNNFLYIFPYITEETASPEEMNRRLQELPDAFHSEMEEEKDRINSTIKQILTWSWSQSLNQSLTRGFAVNESNDEVNISFNLSQLDVAYKVDKRKNYVYLKPANFTLPVKITDTIYKLPSTQGDGHLTLAFDFHYNFSRGEWAVQYWDSIKRIDLLLKVFMNLTREYLAANVSDNKLIHLFAEREAFERDNSDLKHRYQSLAKEAAGYARDNYKQEWESREQQIIDRLVRAGGERARIKQWVEKADKQIELKWLDTRYRLGANKIKNFRNSLYLFNWSGYKLKVTDRTQSYGEGGQEKGKEPVVDINWHYFPQGREELVHPLQKQIRRNLRMFNQFNSDFNRTFKEKLIKAVDENELAFWSFNPGADPEQLRKKAKEEVKTALEATVDFYKNQVDYDGRVYPQPDEIEAELNEIKWQRLDPEAEYNGHKVTGPELMVATAFEFNLTLSNRSDYFLRQQWETPLVYHNTSSFKLPFDYQSASNTDYGPYGDYLKSNLANFKYVAVKEMKELKKIQEKYMDYLTASVDYFRDQSLNVMDNADKLREEDLWWDLCCPVEESQFNFDCTSRKQRLETGVKNRMEEVRTAVNKQIKRDYPDLARLLSSFDSDSSVNPLATRPNVLELACSTSNAQGSSPHYSLIGYRNYPFELKTASKVKFKDSHLDQQEKKREVTVFYNKSQTLTLTLPTDVKGWEDKVKEIYEELEAAEDKFNQSLRDNLPTLNWWQLTEADCESFFDDLKLKRDDVIFQAIEASDNGVKVEVMDKSVNLDRHDKKIGSEQRLCTVKWLNLTSLLTSTDTTTLNYKSQGLELPITLKKTLRLYLDDYQLFGNQEPRASFDYSPRSPNFNQQITFDASSTYDPNLDAEQYFWNLNNDGSFLGSKIIRHKYSGGGLLNNKERDIQVTLEVRDSKGATDTAKEKIHLSKSN